MRKRTVNHVADTIFWYIIYFLPIIATVIIWIGGYNSEAWAQYVMEDGFDIDTLVSSFAGVLGTVCSYLGISNNFILVALTEIFQVDGLVPIFHDTGILQFFSWFIAVYIVHLCVDFLLFIPRLAHKWMKEFTKGDI